MAGKAARQRRVLRVRRMVVMPPAFSEFIARYAENRQICDNQAALELLDLGKFIVDSHERGDQLGKMEDGKFVGVVWPTYFRYH